MGRTLGFGLVILCGTAAAVRALDDPAPQRFEFAQPHMGTLFRIVLYAPDEAAGKKAALAAFARVAELNRIMSDYDPTSELMRLCKQAGGEPVRVSKELFDVLERAEEIARATDGAFDISIGPVVRLWRKARRTRQLPDAERLKEALARVDFSKIRLDRDRRTVRLLLMGMLLDLGGIAKGYAADAMLVVLAAHGIDRALVAAGGDVTVAEAPPGRKGWTVGIAPLKDPSGPPTHLLTLRRAGVSTSGDAEQYVEIDGKRYSHVADPRTGLGLNGRRSVSVIAPRGMDADALATAACVLGPEKGLAFLESRPGIEGIYVWEADGKVQQRTTRGFGKMRLQEGTTKNTKDTK